MRLASFEHDFWRLRSGEQCHRDSPDTFWIPPHAQRQSLKRGQAARLVFELEGEDKDGQVRVGAERMWVVVAEKVGDIYLGILTDRPVSLVPGEDVYLCAGAEVPFRAEHVIEIDDPDPRFAELWLGVAPTRRWPRE
jgi:hypothetical protein